MPGETRGRRMKVSEHRMTFMVTIGLLIFFLWMDIALYYRVQSLPPPSPPKTLSPSTGAKTGQTDSAKLFSPFTGLSIKMMMLDQVNNYIHIPTANLFNKVTNFSEVFSYISPNMLSFAGFLSACAAARFVMYDSLSLHRLAVFMFFLRTWFDALDGLVARERRHMVQFLSLRETSGYVVDGVADACGFSVFLIGCFFFLKNKLPTCKMYLPMTQHEKSRASNYMPYSPKRIAIVLGCFGLQLAFSCIFWDHYINEYHELLEVHSSRIHPQQQSEVLRSSLMWIIMWFWRVANAHSLMHFFLFFVFTDHMWDFLLWIQYIGMVNLGVLVTLTEIHLRGVKSYLQ